MSDARSGKRTTIVESFHFVSYYPFRAYPRMMASSKKMQAHTNAHWGRGRLSFHVIFKPCVADYGHGNEELLPFNSLCCIAVPFQGLFVHISYLFMANTSFFRIRLDWSNEIRSMIIYIYILYDL